MGSIRTGTRGEYIVQCDTGNSSKDTGRKWSASKFRHPKTQLRIQTMMGTMMWAERLNNAGAYEQTEDLPFQATLFLPILSKNVYFLIFLNCLLKNDKYDSQVKYLILVMKSLWPLVFSKGCFWQCLLEKVDSL